MLRKLGRLSLIILIALVVVLSILIITNDPVPDYPFFESPGPLVIAHQGGEGLRPSNTMAAFENAVALGVDVLEMDIHATADNVLVLMHDDTVDRTTDGSGRIREMTLAEIKTLDAGYYWTDDGGQTYPYRGQGIQVPTLEEIFTAFPLMRMNIEIKPDDPAAAELLCQYIADYDMGDQVLVASFHPESIRTFRAACPEVATSLVEQEILRFFILNTLFLGRLYRSPGAAMQVPEHSGNIHVLTNRFVRGNHALNMDVHAWTINETADMERLIALGVDGIITDRPDRMLELLGR